MTKNKKKYYFHNQNGKRIGPKSVDALYFIFITGKLTQSTLVECENDIQLYSEILESYKTATDHHKHSYGKEIGSDDAPSIGVDKTKPILKESKDQFPFPPKKEKKEPQYLETPSLAKKVSSQRKKKATNQDASSIEADKTKPLPKESKDQFPFPPKKEKKEPQSLETPPLAKKVSSQRKKKAANQDASSIEVDKTKPIPKENEEHSRFPQKKETQVPQSDETLSESKKISPDTQKASNKLSLKGKKKKTENSKILPKNKEENNQSASRIPNKSRFPPFFQTLIALATIGVAFSIFIFFWIYSWPDLSDPTVLNEILNDKQTIDANRLSTDKSEEGDGRLYASWRQRLGESVFFPNRIYYTGWASEGRNSKLFYFKDGKKDGPFVETYSNKRIMTKGTYDDGKLVEAKVLKPNEELCTESEVKDGKGVLVSYNDNGIQRSRVSYQDGKPIKE